LMMRANPHVLSGLNKYWVKFFILAVYATMYVRDHARPAFHRALGVDPTEYDYQVFNITSEISKQVFPLTVDSDHPAFRASLERLRKISDGMSAAKERGGIIGRIKWLTYGAGAALSFARLYLIPAKNNELPAQSRLVPTW